MALRPCSHCGKPISDKAKVCPKCGAKNQPESTEAGLSASEMDAHNSLPEIPADSLEEGYETPKSRTGFYLILAVVAVIIAAAIGYYFYADRQAKKEEARLKAVRLDSLRLDSLAAARLDSIRRDSIARRNFTTPDLAFGELHGDVKKCEVNTDCNFTYDEKGNWTNAPKWTEFDKKYCPERTQHSKVERDKNGYITRIYFECDADYEYENIRWEDGKVKSRFLSSYSYDDNGFIVGREDEEEYDTQVSAIYCNYEVDEMGNWVKRDVVEKIIDCYQNTVRYDSKTEKRNITYHKSKSGKHLLIPNNAQQKQALKNVGAYRQKPDDKIGTRRTIEVTLGYTVEYGSIQSAYGSYGYDVSMHGGQISSKMIIVPSGKKWTFRSVNRNENCCIKTYSIYPDKKLRRDKIYEVGTSTREGYVFYGGDNFLVTIDPIHSDRLESREVVFTFIEENE